MSSRDGVVHVVESVLIPPRRNKADDMLRPEEYEDDQMTINELVERLEPYVETGDDFFGDL